MTPEQQELESAERDLAAALAQFKQIEEKLETAEAWVSAAIEREQAARFAVRAAARRHRQNRGAREGTENRCLLAS